MRTISTKQAAHILRVTRPMVGFYQRKGLLTPMATPAGMRGAYFILEEVTALANKLGHEKRKRARLPTRRDVVREMSEHELSPEDDQRAAKAIAPDMVLRETYTTEEGIAVIRALKNGSSIEDCSEICRVHPDRVRAIAATFAEMRSTVILTGQDLHELRALVPVESFPFANARAFIDAVKATLRGSACLKCQRKRASICRGCARAASKQESEPSP